MNIRSMRLEIHSSDKSEYSKGTRPRFKVLLLLMGLLCGATSNVTAVEPSQRDVEFARIDGRSLKFDLYRPSGNDTETLSPLVVWVHGGAWRAGSKENVPVTGWLKYGFAIASVEYRLSPQARFPAQVHDIKAAIRFLRAHAAEYGLDADRFIIAGASAGGHLAALTGVSKDVDELEGSVGDQLETSSDVQSIVSFYGASNLQTILGQSTEHGLSVRVPALQLLLGGQPLDVPEIARLASPVAHVDEDDPPLWLIHGDSDPQMPPQQSHELKAEYEEHKLPVDHDVVEGGKHGGDEFYTDARLDRLANAILATLTERRDDKTTASPLDRPVRLLFAGSSSTYWNDLPGEVARIVDRQMAGLQGEPVTAEIVGRSGSDIRVYLDPECNYQYGVKPGQSFLDKVRDEKFDYVSMMVVCRFITGDGEDNPDGKAHAAAVTRYCQAIRDAGGEPVFYEMGWGSGEREVEGRRRILELAKQNRIHIYAPCSTAWARIRSERPDLELQHPGDKSHPGDLGHFTNLACFYAALTGQSPVGRLPSRFHVWPHLSKEEKKQRREQLDVAFSQFKPDTYQARLPEWMRRNAGAGFVGQISDDDARYIERVAWECVQATQKELTPGQSDSQR
jgi:acetyl esterase/lipase